MAYGDSNVGYYLYKVHTNNEMTIEEKVKDVVNKYEILKNMECWDALKKFFENPIYTRTSYYCETFSNFGNGTIENRYIQTDISHEEAVKGNVYFYILLSIIGGKNDIVAYSANLLSCSDKSNQYLCEYGEKHGLQYECGGRSCEKFLIRITRRCVLEADGHNIYECIELPI